MAEKTEDADRPEVQYLVGVKPEDRRRLPHGSDRLMVPTRCEVCRAAHIASRAGLADSRDLAAKLGRAHRVVCFDCYEPAAVTVATVPDDPEFDRLVRQSEAERN